MRQYPKRNQYQYAAPIWGASNHRKQAPTPARGSLFCLESGASYLTVTVRFIAGCTVQAIWYVPGFVNVICFCWPG